jgi:hypothetical protein
MVEDIVTIQLYVAVGHPRPVRRLEEDPTIDDLPDVVFVALGRRGMEPIPLKECTYACDGKELTVISVTKDPSSIQGRSIEVVVEDWLCKVRYVDGKMIDTMVSLLDDKGNDLGWLGSY